MNKWFYYTRVSTKRQNLDRQLESKELDEFCNRMNLNNTEIIIMEEKASGKDFERPQYKLLKQVINEEDKIIVSSIDRFGRNYMEGRKEFAELLNRGVKVYILNRPMLEELYKLNDNMSKFMINLLVDWELMNAEEELKKSKIRQREGIDVAKAHGKHLGRPKVKRPDNWSEIYSVWKKGEIPAVKAMEILNLKKDSFYKLAKEYESIINDFKFKGDK